MADEGLGHDAREAAGRVGQRAAASVAELGLAGWMLAQSAYWLGRGRARGQPVRLAAVATEAREIGIAALPIATQCCGSVVRRTSSSSCAMVPTSTRPMGR